MVVQCLGKLCLLGAPGSLVLRPLCTGELQRQMGLGDAGKAALLLEGNPVLQSVPEVLRERVLRVCFLHVNCPPSAACSVAPLLSCLIFSYRLSLLLKPQVFVLPPPLPMAVTSSQGPFLSGGTFSSAPFFMTQHHTAIAQDPA